MEECEIYENRCAVLCCFDMMPCSLVGVHSRFGGTNCLHLQVRRVSQARNQQEAAFLISCCLLDLLLDPNVWALRQSTGDIHLFSHEMAKAVMKRDIRIYVFTLH
jgi:hypothetical protein